MLSAVYDTLSGDDSELKTVWDEICAQVQDEESFYWAAYDRAVRAIVSDYVSKLADHEREAMWLQTEAADDWLFDEPGQDDAVPVSDDDIVDWLTREYVYPSAARWSNTRIRAYLNRCSIRD